MKAVIVIKYYLNVTTKYKDGYGSRWYGWSQQLTFDTYSQALEKKKKIEHLFHEVEILEV